MAPGRSATHAQASALFASTLRQSTQGPEVWVPPGSGATLSPSAPSPRPSPNLKQPRQTQRYAAERLLDTLRKHTAIVPQRDQHVHSVDEVLALGASAVFGLAEEVQAQQREVIKLRGELGAAYRASAIAAADDISAARREAEDTEQRAAYVAQQAAAREAELEAAVLAAHAKLADEQRARAAVQRQLEQTTAGNQLLEQRLEATSEAAKQLLAALPASASDEAASAERVRRVAQGEELPGEWAGADVLDLLGRALERALRGAEQVRSSEAEATLLRAELDTERLAISRLREQVDTLTDAQRASAEERASLRRETADALAGKDQAEHVARRFQALLGQQQRELEAHHQLLQQQQQQQREIMGVVAPAGAAGGGSSYGPAASSYGPADATAAVDFSTDGAAFATSASRPSSTHASPLRSHSPCSLAGSMAGMGLASFGPTPSAGVGAGGGGLALSDASVAAAAAAVDGLEAAVREAASMTALLTASRVSTPVAMN
jgi:hypothetical protein